jgi:hypothetical protein
MRYVRGLYHLGELKYKLFFMSPRHVELRFHPLQHLSYVEVKSYRSENSLNRFSVPKYIRIYLDLINLAPVERAIEKKRRSQKHKMAILAVRHENSELQAGCFLLRPRCSAYIAALWWILPFSYPEPPA